MRNIIIKILLIFSSIIEIISFRFILNMLNEYLVLQILFCTIFVILVEIRWLLAFTVIGELLEIFLGIDFKVSAVIFSIIYSTILVGLDVDDIIIWIAKKKRPKELKKKEKEIIEDAKNLIKSVDERITIADFTVYKVTFLLGASGIFKYDEFKDSLDIFIPFKKLKTKYSKDYLFNTVVHEIMHSQNRKNGEWMFEDDFLEGLNELLTAWVIKNHSKKYKMKKSYITYEETKMVEKIIKDAGVDMKEIFVNYLEANPDFFKTFVPKKYFL